MTTVRRERLRSELREEILAAARELFLSEGYARVSIRGIAERVGCAPGTIYLHFPDKGAILGTLVVETFSRLDKRMEALAKDDGPPLEKLRRGLRTYIQFGLDNPQHYLLTFSTSHAGQRDPEAKSAGLRSFDALRQCVGACAAAKLLRRGDVEELAQTAWCCAHGVVILLITECEFPFIEQTRLVESMLDTVIEGIRAH